MRFIWILFIFCSCTTLHFESKNSIPIYLGHEDHEMVEREFEDVMEYYLWGLVPGEQTVMLDDFLKEKGVRMASNLKIEVDQNWQDYMVSYLSLGMYIPKRFRISGRMLFVQEK